MRKLTYKCGLKYCIDCIFRMGYGLHLGVFM